MSIASQKGRPVIYGYRYFRCYIGLTVDHIFGILKEDAENHTLTMYECQRLVNFIENLRLLISNNKYQILTSNHIVHKPKHPQ